MIDATANGKSFRSIGLGLKNTTSRSCRQRGTTVSKLQDGMERSILVAPMVQD